MRHLCKYEGQKIFFVYETGDYREEIAVGYFTDFDDYDVCEKAAALGDKPHKDFPRYYKEALEELKYE